ncbi:M15 family metallopeptidase [Blastopirellula marina]|uniref:Peptidase M15 n=1 Tax=Blastopirellula marina TaxID=124 RepID=A0A2S8GTH0_9BACT|nr:M15 family metallopeptidase [Blastopirellula marina]PQO47364.1 peptidase M15 [Blastopirellula marina]
MTYDDKNDAAISKLDPAMQHKVRHLLDRLVLVAEDILLTRGLATNEEQNDLYAQGRTKPGAIVTNAKAGQSVHNYGCAIDFVPVGPLGVPLDKRYKLEWAALGRYESIAAIAKEIGFEWGGDWTSFPDKPHLQYVDGLSLTDLKNGKRPSEAKAKRERRKDSEEKLRIAEMAQKRKLNPDRQKRLTAFVNRMKRLLERF